MERLGGLRDALGAGGYTGHDLEQFLVRVLFCLFAEDTGLFDREAFALFLENHTREDGSDLGPALAAFFEALNTPPERRQAHLLEELRDLPYVNGQLFAERLGFPAFDRRMRDTLLTCCRFDWSRISPAVFGSLFQSVMVPAERRQVGAHYTSERDILKLVNSLFLDDARARFGRLKANRGTRRRADLEAFHVWLGGLTVLDPACGCGNFLVVTYRELRLLELEVLRELYPPSERQRLLSLDLLSRVDVDAMFGIELNEFPARIAAVALWLVDHQMNQRLSEEFGQLFVRLPLSKSATIVHGNALRLDWRTVLPAERCAFVLGNPPFVGHQYRTVGQVEDMDRIWGDGGRFGQLDYVTAWYRVTADYIAGSRVRCAFVSTNSISQGEQVGILWEVLHPMGIRIDFAHRTFSWESEARGAAHVHVVIIGFSYPEPTSAQRRLYDYDGGNDPTVTECDNINGYLLAAPHFLLPSRTRPPEGRLQMKKGSQPTDGGHLILSQEERDQLVKTDPLSEQWIRPYHGTDEYLHRLNRYCLWLKGANPSELKRCPNVLARLESVRQSRLKSPTPSVRAFADRPSLFTQDRQPVTEYLAVPEVSSELRKYVPIGFLPPSVIASNKIQMIIGAPMFYFGVLSSALHMAWVRAVAGRLKSDFSYAPSVYNNFPWPDGATEAQRAVVVAKAGAVLSVRERHSTSALAILYDPITMPPNLVRAHTELDAAVDRCYRPQAFASERQRVEFLFELYARRSG